MTDVVDALASQLGRQLIRRQLMVATAESCTGGLVSSALTDIAGSSAWFERGFVTYSNHAKIEMLGVPPDLIETHGAVSEEVARAMAEGALLESRAQVVLEELVQSETMHFAGDRASVREQSVRHALGGLLLRVAS
jgi:nicotinamide-nucleotide amidase